MKKILVGILLFVFCLVVAPVSADGILDLLYTNMVIVDGPMFVMPDLRSNGPDWTCSSPTYNGVTMGTGCWRHYNGLIESKYTPAQYYGRAWARPNSSTSYSAGVCKGVGSTSYKGLSTNGSGYKGVWYASTNSQCPESPN